MQFGRFCEYLSVAKITGPTHNLLQIALGTSDYGGEVECERLPPVESLALTRLNEAEVVAAVLQGIQRGNAKFETAYRITLASMSPPFNHFEVAEYRDRSLEELGVDETSGSEAITLYAAETLRLAMAGEIDLPSSLAIVKDLCVSSDYPKNLYDFYLLHFAYKDLQDSEIQWYWSGADRSNIETIFKQRVLDFLSSNNDA